MNIGKGCMRTGGLEPPRENSHYHLKVARIPIPPRSLVGFGFLSNPEMNTLAESFKILQVKWLH